MTRQEFPIVAPGKFATVFPILLGAVVPLLIFSFLFFIAKDAHDWQDPAKVLVILPIVAGFLGWSMHGKHVDVEDGKLVLRRFPFPRRMPLTDFDLALARIVNLDDERALQPTMKIAGSGLPGYRTGWFRLRDKRKAWVTLTDWKRVLVLPKRDGHVVLLSPERPDALLVALRRAAG